MLMGKMASVSPGGKEVLMNGIEKEPAEEKKGERMQAKWEDPSCREDPSDVVHAAHTPGSVLMDEDNRAWNIFSRSKSPVALMFPQAGVG